MKTLDRGIMLILFPLVFIGTCVVRILYIPVQVWRDMLPAWTREWQA